MFPKTEDHKRKISEALINHSVSNKTRNKISSSLFGRFTKEKSSNWKGGHNKCIDCDKLLGDRYAKRCNTCDGKYNSRERHYRWNGFTPIIEKLRFCNLYIHWRTKVFERDRWTCQTCRARGVYVEAHHIKPFSLIVKENNIKDMETAEKCEELWNLDNGVTLCGDCHNLTKGRPKK